MTRPRFLPAMVPLLVLFGTAGWPWSRPEPLPEQPAPVVVELPPPAPTLEGPLWDGTLPLDLGPGPEGVASISAQACAACHWTAHETWAESAHANAAASPGFEAAVASVDRPECWSCHRPLAQQHSHRVQWVEGAPESATHTPNPSWSASLMLEGVTCAACHVRDGTVLTPSAVEAAPHPVLHAPQLLETEACAGCHQMTWPGADQPLYDTVGEYERSPWAAAGVGCLDCHGRPAAGTTGVPSHDVTASLARALTVETTLARDHVSRGGDGLAVRVDITNSGSAHAIPTGSPWRAVEIRAELVVYPSDPDAQAPVVGPDPLVHRLQRVLQDAPPFETRSDSRLAPGASASIDGILRAPLDLPSGRAEVRVTVRELASGRPQGEPVASWVVPVGFD